MLTAWHNPLVCRWFDWYCASALRRHFYAVRGYGRGPTPGEAGPRLVVAATHQSFWDGIVLNWWLKSLGWRRRWCMIDAEQVCLHPFFRKIGGFGVERGDPADARRSVRYAASLLDDATPREPAALVIFPQGRIVHPALPIEIEPGVWFVARAADAPVLPLALAYELWEEQRPELLIRPGELQRDFARLSRRQGTGVLCGTMASLRRVLTGDSAANSPGDLLLHGRRSIKDLGRRRTK